MAVNLLPLYQVKNRKKHPKINTATRSMSLQDKCDLGATTGVVTSHLHPPLWEAEIGRSCWWLETPQPPDPGAWTVWIQKAQVPREHSITSWKRTRFSRSQSNIPVTQGRLTEVPLGPGCSVSEVEVKAFLTYDAKLLCECNSLEILRWEGKEICYFY